MHEANVHRYTMSELLGCKGISCEDECVLVHREPSAEVQKGTGARPCCEAASLARVVVASCASAGLLADLAHAKLTMWRQAEAHAAAAATAGFTHIFIDEAG